MNLSRFLLAALLLAPGAALADCPAAPLGPPAFRGVDVIEVCHAGYLSLLDPGAKQTRVVAYELTAAHAHGQGSRAGLSFKVDLLAPAEDQGRASDYAGSGYDLGHMAPAEDFAWDARLERDTFSMANVAPQLPDLNRQGWERIEELVRAEACRRGRIDIFTGPIYPSSATIGADRLPVPQGFFKIALDPGAGWGLAFLVKQAPLAKGDAADHAVAIATVEAAAGMRFPLPVGVDREAVTAPDAKALEDYRAGHCVAPGV